MKPVLSVSGLSFKYPEYTSVKNRTLYKNLSFEIVEGDIALFLAPPETGKTTLSRIITSLIPRYTGGELEGTVTVSDVNVHKEKPYNLNEKVGIVFQDPEEQILTPLVENEIAFALESAGLDHDEIEKKLIMLLISWKLTGLKEKILLCFQEGRSASFLFPVLPQQILISGFSMKLLRRLIRKQG